MPASPPDAAPPTAEVVEDGNPAPRSALARRNASRFAGLLVLAGVLVLVMLLSVAVGAKALSLPQVLDGLLHGGDSEAAVVIRDLRLPRTLIGAMVGVALGLAGALMQALTRNPLADPGILGVNMGASAAVVTAISFLGLSAYTSYVWFAFVGAAVTAVVVYVLGAQGRSGATPVRLALAGAAIAAALGAYTSAIVLLDSRTFDQYRFWSVGSFAVKDLGIVGALAPFVAVGVVLALVLGKSLNAVALGDDTGRALGASIGRTRLLTAIAVTLLCGAATAAAGPIGFIGLTAPHMARLITGPDQRWVLPYSMFISPVIVLAADVVGRVVNRPGELEVGIVTAFIGAPLFIALVRRKRIAQL